MSDSEGDEPPLVSVVTPAYNEENFIRKTLASVSNQDYDNIEHVVVNDGSTDDTAATVRRFKSDHDVVLRSRENRGQVKSVNEALEMADGEFVIWLNGDDVLFSRTVVSDVVAEFRDRPDVDILYGVQATLTGDSEIQKFVVPPLWFSYGRLLRRYFGIFTFMRSSVTDEYRLDDDYGYAPDYEYYLRVAAGDNQIEYIDEVTYGWRTHEESKTEHSTDKLEAESRRCREEYGASFGWRSKLLLGVDMVLDRLLRLYGLKFVVKYARNEGLLAFSNESYSLRVGVRRQLASMLP